MKGSTALLVLGVVGVGTLVAISASHPKLPEPPPNTYEYRGCTIKLEELSDGRWRWRLTTVTLDFLAGVAFSNMGENQTRDGAIAAAKHEIDGVLG